MKLTILLYIAAVVLLLCGSAFFSAAEMAISAANRTRLENQAEDGDRRSASAVRLLDRYDNALSAILIGNNLCNIGSDSLVTVLTVLLFGANHAGWINVATTLLMTCVIIVFCESIPKIAAKKNANRWAAALAGLLRGLMVILWPVIFLVRALIALFSFPFKGEKGAGTQEEAEAELRSVLETVEDEGVIDEDRSEMLQNALDFSEIPVMDVMTARVDMVAVDAEDDWDEIVALLDKAPFSRIPVYDGSIDDILGVLYLNKFYRTLLSPGSGQDIRSYLMKPLYLYKTVKLPDAMNAMRRSQQHLAIVTDEYGGTLGIVTLEDVLEQIVGDIWDESDTVETEMVELPDGVYETDGDVPVSDIAELMGISEADMDTDSATIGGWAIEKLGTFPKAGDCIEDGALRVTVLQMDEDGLRVERVRVTKR